MGFSLMYERGEQSSPVCYLSQNSLIPLTGISPEKEAAPGLAPSAE